MENMQIIFCEFSRNTLWEVPLPWLPIVTINLGRMPVALKRPLDLAFFGQSLHLIVKNLLHDDDISFHPHNFI